MYEESETVVGCAIGSIESFKVKVGLHQGSALSPFLFAMIMDRLTDEVKREPPWTMLFADDIVICKETRKEVEQRLECWRYALERREMKVSRSKTIYLCINGGNDKETVKMEDTKVPRVKKFKYLRSTVQESGSCHREVKKRVQAGWNGWRKVSEVICDRRLPARAWVSKPGVATPNGVGVIIAWGRKEVIGSVGSLKYRKGWMYKTSKI